MTSPFEGTKLAVAAIQLHEVFLELVEAGFKEEHAIQLIQAIIMAGTMNDNNS